jgi:putative transposase
MAQTLTSLFVHVVFSTKDRTRQIGPEIEGDLYAYIGGVLRRHECLLMAAGGMPDHIHLLISFSKKMSISDSVRELKRASSAWLKGKGCEFRDFHWQDGYAAFSVCRADLQNVRRYISNQQEHHKIRRFEEELRSLLNDHNVEFDEALFMG